MVVKIRYPKQGKGDQVVELELEEARQEIEEAAKQDYNLIYNKAVIQPQDVKDGMDISLYPRGRGG